MSRATNEEWARYYETAHKRRQRGGPDALERYLERKETRERQFFIVSSLLLAGVLVVFYSILVG